MHPRVRSAALANYMTVAQAAGIDAHAHLRAAGLEVNDLQRPDQWLPSTAVMNLLNNSAHSARLDDFGLRMVTGRRLPMLGPLSLLAHVEPTKRRVLQAMIQYIHLHNEVTHLHLEESGGTAILHAHLHNPQLLPARQARELNLGALIVYLRHILGPAWEPQLVSFSHAAPARLATHLRVLGAPLGFNADFDGVVLRSSELDAAVDGADDTIAAHVRRYLDSLSTPRHRSLAHRVRQLVETLLPAGQCDAAEVARHLGMAQRTFYLQMQREGGSFAAILEAARREAALSHLGNSNRSLSELAGLLGFSGLSAFSRWFRQQFGCSASAWMARKRLQDGAPSSGKAPGPA